MVSPGTETHVRLVAGGLVCLAGTLVVRYPEPGYALWAGWRHEDASLSPGGRTAQRLLGVVVSAIGVGVVIWGLSWPRPHPPGCTR